MYEKNQPSAMRRSGDEFLRRMTGSEMVGRSIPTMNRQMAQQGSCVGEGTGVCGGNTSEPAPSCSYPNNPAMPSLAMVYAPEQEWRCLLNPTQALAEGTLFAELVKPFEGRSIYRKTR